MTKKKFKFNFQSGEIATLIALGSMAFILVTSLVSRVFVQKPQITTTFAGGCPYKPTSEGKALCDSDCKNKGGCTTCIGGGGYICAKDIQRSPTPANQPTSDPGKICSTSGFYSTQTSCEGICGVNQCDPCRSSQNKTQPDKWDCKGGSGGGITCETPNWSSASNCKSGAGGYTPCDKAGDVCTKCGTNRYECNGKGPVACTTPDYQCGNFCCASTQTCFNKDAETQTEACQAENDCVENLKCSPTSNKLYSRKVNKFYPNADCSGSTTYFSGDEACNVQLTDETTTSGTCTKKDCWLNIDNSQNVGIYQWVKNSQTRYYLEKSDCELDGGRENTEETFYYNNQDAAADARKCTLTNPADETTGSDTSCNLYSYCRNLIANDYSSDKNCDYESTDRKPIYIDEKNKLYSTLSNGECQNLLQSSAGTWSPELDKYCGNCLINENGEGQNEDVNTSKEGTCVEGGKTISWGEGNCTYQEHNSYEADCGNNYSVENENSCIIYRVCPANSAANCMYRCYYNNKVNNCINAADPDTYNGRLRVLNNTNTTIKINQIRISSETGGKFLLTVPQSLSSKQTYYASFKFGCELYADVFISYNGEENHLSGHDSCGVFSGPEIFINITPQIIPGE